MTFLLRLNSYLNVMPWKTRAHHSESGFTLIELVMVMIILSVLASVAIPEFLDFRTDAKNSTAKGALGAFRSALTIATAAIALKEDPTTLPPKYPTLLEMQANKFGSSHIVLSGTYLMDFQAGTPTNPWSISTLAAAQRNSVINCNTTKSLIASVSGIDFRGWCYRETSGEIWANSNLNGSTAGNTENTY